MQYIFPLQTECCFINPTFWFIEIHGHGQIGGKLWIPIYVKQGALNWLTLLTDHVVNTTEGPIIFVLCWSPGYDHMLIHWPVCPSSEIHTWMADQKWDASYWSVRYGRNHHSSNLLDLLTTGENLNQRNDTGLAWLTITSMSFLYCVSSIFFQQQFDILL